MLQPQIVLALGRRLLREKQATCARCARKLVTRPIWRSPVSVWSNRTAGHTMSLCDAFEAVC
eukprot:3025009-Prymnesium_polylepis.1